MFKHPGHKVKKRPGGHYRRWDPRTWIVDAGNGAVWSKAERDAEAERRRVADAAAAANAEAATQAAINAINSNGALTQRQKVSALFQLRASGYSRREFTMIWEAKAAAEALL